MDPDPDPYPELGVRPHFYRELQITGGSSFPLPQTRRWSTDSPGGGGVWPGSDSSIVAIVAGTQEPEAALWTVDREAGH